MTEQTKQLLERHQRVLARIRQRQLDLALKGRIDESVRHADRAQRVRRVTGMAALPSDIKTCVEPIAME